VADRHERAPRADHPGAAGDAKNLAELGKRRLGADAAGDGRGDEQRVAAAGGELRRQPVLAPRGVDVGEVAVGVDDDAAAQRRVPARPVDVDRPALVGDAPVPAACLVAGDDLFVIDAIDVALALGRELAGVSRGGGEKSRGD
jgi:hypothetical protein